MAQSTTSHPIPLAYRIWHIYIEPVSAILGAVQSLYITPTYLSVITDPSVYGPGAPLTSLNWLLLTQVASLYVMLGVVEHTVLRSSKDIKVWKGVVLAIACSDWGHLYAAWIAQGGLEGNGATFWDPRVWRMEEWINLGITWFGCFLRLAFLAGIGMGSGKTEEKVE